MHGRCHVATQHAIDCFEGEIPAMTSLDHFADHPGTQHVRIRLTKVCSLLTEGSAKPVDDYDIAHTVCPSRHKKNDQSRAAIGPRVQWYNDVEEVERAGARDRHVQLLAHEALDVTDAAALATVPSSETVILICSRSRSASGR